MGTFLFKPQYLKCEEKVMEMFCITLYIFTICFLKQDLSPVSQVGLGFKTIILLQLPICLDYDCAPP